MHTDLRNLCVKADWSVMKAVACMDLIKTGIVLVVDDERRLLGTVTDGDVRRAILAGVNLERPVQALLDRKQGTRYATPITAPMAVDRAVHLSILKQHSLLYLPLLDEEQRVAALVTLDEFLPEPAPLHAVVMAGGRGQRLHPLTEDTPKPMLHVGDRPLLEIIIEQLRAAGIRDVKITTHHRPEKIADHFGDGQQFGVALSYVEENQPLGTVGGLGLLEPPKETMLVINGDILTQVDFRAMLAYHKEHEADLTVAVRHYEMTVPYGVVECEGSSIQRLTEKPVMSFFVNAGIYLMEPSVHRFIPQGRRFDMTDLIQRLLHEQRPVVSFPIREYWLDIGEHTDYERAQEQAKAWKQGAGKRPRRARSRAPAAQRAAAET